MKPKLLRIGILILGVNLVLLMMFAVHLSSVEAYHDGTVPLPNDYRNWFHVGSKSISADAATALGMPADVFGETFDAVFANTVALNDLRSGHRPFREGASFVAPFYTLNHPVDGLDATGDLAFVAVMLKDTEHFGDTNGWGFTAYSPDRQQITALADSCFTCHQAQAENDFVFSTLSERAVSAVPASDNGVFLPPDYRQMYWRNAKVIRPDAATALGLPAEIFGNTFDSIYLNQEALGALGSETRPFPVGSLFVADFHQAAFPIEGLAAEGADGFTAVMLKGTAGTGDDPSTGDWKFEAFGADGTPLSELRPACISCHAPQASNDYVFSGAS
ncbi:MAG: cytochrome P460 family protein [Chloroflexota bacterium]